MCIVYVCVDVVCVYSIVCVCVGIIIFNYIIYN